MTFIKTLAAAAAGAVLATSAFAATVVAPGRVLRQVRMAYSLCGSSIRCLLSASI